MNKKRVLITAGSTAMMIDKVRKISNIFQGRTGYNIAKHANNIGCDVTLLTSSPPKQTERSINQFKILAYNTFDDLEKKMAEEIRFGKYDAIIHSAAVSDYKPCALWQKTISNNTNNHNVNEIIEIIKTNTVGAGSETAKISSGQESVFLEMQATPKLVDCIRQQWGFTGVLIKFKLQVDMQDSELLAIAERSRQASKADFIVANCLEWATEYAYIINSKGEAEYVQRSLLAQRLLELLNKSCLKNA
ncbi:MAG: phosphopantothenoylcysteine decarboxylase [Mariprofundales bacterium]